MVYIRKISSGKSNYKMTRLGCILTLDPWVCILYIFNGLHRRDKFWKIRCFRIRIYIYIFKNIIPYKMVDQC